MPKRRCELVTPEPEVYTGHWYTPKRTEVIRGCKRLKIEKENGRSVGTKSYEDIYKAAEVSSRTCRLWRAQSHERRRSETNPLNRGRKRLVNDEILDAVESWMLCWGFEGRATAWKDVIEELQICCSPQTLQRSMKRRGYSK